jgi:hypothetical protein
LERGNRGQRVKGVRLNPGTLELWNRKIWNLEFGIILLEIINYLLTFVLSIFQY